MGKRWYLVHAKTGGEPLAELNLRRQSYEAFLPLTHRTIRHARKIRDVTRALFPGYLFVAFDIERDRWRPINGTIGVLRIITASERPLAAPVGLVETLIASANENGLIDRAQRLAPGDEVRVIRGPFADQLGRVVEMRPMDRVRVLLSIMQANVPVEVSVDACAREDGRGLQIGT